MGDALAGLAAAEHLCGKVPDTSIACRFDTVGGVGAGIGASLLPCFAGDCRPGLVRLSPPIAMLATDLRLLTHANLRHVPWVRVVMEFLGQRLAAFRLLLEGSLEAANVEAVCALAGK